MPGKWVRNVYQQMPYYVLAPDGYDPNGSTTYPVVLHLHQYQNDGAQPGQADPWYNTDAFRMAHPCIVVLPLCVIGSQRSTPDFNWGGVDTRLQQPIVLALAILDLVVAQMRGDKRRLLVTGNSMGGLGAWGILCNPDQRTRFAAAMPVSGSCYYCVGQEPQTAAALKDFPIWSCHGGQDTQVSPAFDQAMWREMQRIGGKMMLTSDPNAGHDVWDGFYPRGDAWNWLFSQSKGAPMAASPDRTTVTAGSTGTIVDNAGIAWTITAGGQVAYNGKADTTTSGVTQLAWAAGVLWQCNAAGNWYSSLGGGLGWSAATKTNPLTGAVSVGAFSVRGGKILDPQGNVYVAAGMNNRPSSVSNGDAILKMFPGISFIRLAMEGFADPAAWNGFITKMEAAGVVCLKEYHPWPLVSAQSGSALTNEANSAGAWASYYRGRPYVWISSMNEPQGGDITSEHVAVYNAVRAADPSKIVMLSAGVGSGNPGATGTKVLRPAAYAAMTNVVWDLHYYGWAPKYSTDLATCKATLLGSAASGTGIAAVQAIPSADGIVPVIVGEFGPSTSGSALDVNAGQVIQAVLDVTASGQASGFAGWAWSADPINALQSGGVPTQWGKQLASGIAAASRPQQPPQPSVTVADVIKQIDATAADLATVRASLVKLQGG